MRCLIGFAFNLQCVVGATQILPTALWSLFFMRYIPNKEYLYSITDDGVIFSFKGKRSNWLYRILQPYKNKKTWYLTLNLVWWKAATIHRLVALTYIPNPHNYPAVRHLDNNKLNNHVSNLEWCTYQTNVRQAHDDWLMPPVDESTRKRCSMLWIKSRKPVEQYTKDGNFIAKYISVRIASKKTWVREKYISACATWTKHHRTAWWFLWKYIPTQNQAQKEIPIS